MSAKHRKASKLAAKRTAIAATAVGATASIGLMGAPAQAATATPPDYSQAISDYSHALDNFLNASNNVNGSLNTVWGPIANGSGGLLPTFGSTFDRADATNLLDLPKILRNLGTLTLPTAVPGTVPNVVLPGGDKIVLPLPTTVPGGAGLVTIADNLDKIFALPLVKDIVKELPAGSALINGLEFTQSAYHGQYAWKLLGLDGETNFLNTFLRTPSGLSLDLLGIPAVEESDPLTKLALQTALSPVLSIIQQKTILPTDVDLSDVGLIKDGTLPSGTVWVPQGDGTYNFPLGAQLGWWAAAPTAALKLPAWLPGTTGMTDTVISVPIYAAGARLPLNLAEAGVVGANVLLPTANGVYSPVGLTMTNLNTILPFGLTNINVTTGNYIGTNGINVNNGQNLLLVQNPLGIPLPLVYGLGGFNFGVDGAGLTSPSLFGFKLFTDDLLQVGTQAGPNSSAGLIPPDLLPTDPMSGLITGITGPLGVSSLTQILGVDAFIKPVMTAFGPVYQVISSATLKPISDFATQQYGPFINNSASQLLDLSKTLSQQTANLPGAPDTVPATDDNTASNKTLTSGDTPTGPNLLARTQQQPVTGTPDATPDVSGSGDQSLAPAGENSGEDEAPETSTGKHRTGTPVKDIADKITGGLDSVGDKITGGIDKATEKVTGGNDKPVETSDDAADKKDEAPAAETPAAGETDDAPATEDAA